MERILHGMMHGQYVLLRRTSTFCIRTRSSPERCKGVFRSNDNGQHWSSDQPRRQHGDPRDRVARDRSRPSRRDLRGNVASAVEDGRRRSALDEHQAGNHRGFRRVLHPHRSGEAAYRLCKCMLRHLQEHRTRPLQFKKVQGIPSAARRTRKLAFRIRRICRRSTQGLRKDFTAPSMVARCGTG